MDFIQNFIYNLELTEQNELPICRECQKIKLHALKQQKNINNNFSRINVIISSSSSSNSSSEVTEKLKQGCLIIFKKLSRLHADALIIVSQKKILLQITFTQNCNTCSLSASAITHIYVFKKRRKKKYFQCLCTQKR